MKLIVKNHLLNYSNLYIYQDTDYFNFSLDSVLLSHFVSITKNTKNIVDFCTGNAPIPLILSTRCHSKIIGVELQKEVFELAKMSVEENNLEERITILNENIKDVKNYIDNESTDLVTCNPPYFKYKEDSNINSNEIKTIARHEVEMTLEDLMNSASYILKNNGRLAIVHRSERLSDIMTSMIKNKLMPKRIQFVYPTINNNESNIVLVEAVKNGNPGVKVLAPIYVHEENGEYRQEIKNRFEVQYDSKQL